MSEKWKTRLVVAFIVGGVLLTAPAVHLLPAPAIEAPPTIPAVATVTPTPTPTPSPSTRTLRASRSTPRIYVQPDQWPCLRDLWQAESGWDHRARNSSSGAYGIPQALPGHKMRSHGRDWRRNAHTQMRWGLDYLESRYGSPCGGWAHFKKHGWY